MTESRRRARRAEIAGFRAVIAGLRIGNASADAKHRLGIDLIRQAEPGLVRIGVVVGYRAIAAPTSIPFENDSAGITAGGWVGRRGGDGEHVTVVFFEIGLEIVAQPIIYSEFTGHFPTVLNKPGDGMVPGTHGGRNAIVPAVGRAEQETCIIETHVGRKRQAVERSKPALVLAKQKISRRIGFAEG